jgi:3-methyladenine DNA glycosylase AlkD
MLWLPPSVEESSGGVRPYSQTARMPLESNRVADELEARLRALGTPERAAGEKRYLKSELEHLGATVSQNRREVRRFAAKHPDLTMPQLTALVRALWARGIFECRLTAVLLLEAYPSLLSPVDLDLVRDLVRDSNTWALVDPLADHVLGALIVHHPTAASQLDAWAEDPDFWVRRAALLSQLGPLKHGASFDRFDRYADAMLDEREFFIRKAIGWVLRESGKRDPDHVYNWLAPRIGRASGVTVREAVKYLDPDRRDELVAAHRARPRKLRPKNAEAPRTEVGPRRFGAKPPEVGPRRFGAKPTEAAPDGSAPEPPKAPQRAPSDETPEGRVVTQR